MARRRRRSKPCFGEFILVSSPVPSPSPSPGTSRRVPTKATSCARSQCLVQSFVSVRSARFSSKFPGANRTRIKTVTEQRTRLSSKQVRQRQRETHTARERAAHRELEREQEQRKETQQERETVSTRERQRERVRECSSFPFFFVSALKLLFHFGYVFFSSA